MEWRRWMVPSIDGWFHRSMEAKTLYDATNRDAGDAQEGADNGTIMEQLERRHGGEKIDMF
jgi:hypothetical protein